MVRQQPRVVLGSQSWRYTAEHLQGPERCSTEVEASAPWRAPPLPSRRVGFASRRPPRWRRLRLPLLPPPAHFASRCAPPVRLGGLQPLLSEYLEIPLRTARR